MSQQSIKTSFQSLYNVEMDLALFSHINNMDMYIHDTHVSIHERALQGVHKYNAPARPYGPVIIQIM
jgi:hypothetical protein